MKAASEISSAEQTAVIILIQTRREGRKTFLTEIMTIASRPGILRGRPLHGVALHGVAVLLREHGRGEEVFAIVREEGLRKLMSKCSNC